MSAPDDIIAAVDEGFRRMLDAPPPAPCGADSNPHLVNPKDVGEVVGCIKCGDVMVRVSETEARPLTPDELEALVRSGRDA